MCMLKTQVTEQNKFFNTNIYHSESLMKLIKGVSIRNKNTATQYYSRLTLFEKFVNINYKINLDKLIQKLKSKEYDPYDIINEFCVFLQDNRNLSSISFREKIITVKTFLEYNDIEITPRKFKLKVRFPKTIFRHKEAIDKEDIIKILNGCSNLRLKNICNVISLYWLEGNRIIVYQA